MIEKLLTLNQAAQAIGVERIQAAKTLSGGIVHELFTEGIYGAVFEEDKDQGTYTVWVAAPHANEIQYYFGRNEQHNVYPDTHFELKHVGFSPHYDEARVGNQRKVEVDARRLRLSNNTDPHEGEIYLLSEDDRASCAGPLCMYSIFMDSKHRIRLGQTCDFPSRLPKPVLGAAVLSRLIGPFPLPILEPQRKIDEVLRLIGKAAVIHNEYIRDESPYEIYVHDKHMYMSAFMFNSSESQIFSVVEDSDNYINLISLTDREIPEHIKNREGVII